MSRTKKTRPLIVRMADKTDTRVEYSEHHNHESGVCTLPASPKDQFKNGHSRASGGCYYEWEYNGHRVCGCPMCTEKIERRINVKRTRADGKKITRTPDLW